MDALSTSRLPLAQYMLNTQMLFGSSEMPMNGLMFSFRISCNWMSSLHIARVTSTVRRCTFEMKMMLPR